MGDIVDVGIGVVWGNREEKSKSYNKRKTWEGMCRTHLESSESVGKKTGV